MASQAVVCAFCKEGCRGLASATDDKHTSASDATMMARIILPPSYDDAAVKILRDI
jgi:hypothetical protein